MPEIDLFGLDLLPAKCSVSAEMRMEPEIWVRFRATRQKGRFFKREEQSAYTGWYLYENQRIELCWRDFSWPGG